VKVKLGAFLEIRKLQLLLLNTLYKTLLKVTKLHWKILETIKQMKRWRGRIQRMKCLLREAFEELRA